MGRSSVERLANCSQTGIAKVVVAVLAPAILLACACSARAGVGADFNGDGRDDLAIHAQFERVGNMNGAVHVLYGARHGLSVQGDQLFGADTPGLHGGGRSDDNTFGYTLVGGDFNGDGYDDLAIGVPFKTVSVPNYGAGGVHILYGSRRGLVLRGNQYLNENTPGVKGPKAGFDHGFGSALAAADFNRDGRDDLAVGVKGEPVLSDSTEDGAVRVFYGGRNRLSLRGDQYMTPTTPGMTRHNAGRRGLEAEFGSTLAAGDLNGDGTSDLAIGARSQLVGGEKYAGAVRVLHGGPRGLTLKHDQFLNENSKGIAGDGAEFGDEFGGSLAIGRFNSDRRGDLAIGVPQECLGSCDLHYNGAVHVLYGGQRKLSLRGDQYFTERSVGSANPKQQTQFGRSLEAADLDGNGRQDLAIGAPWEHVAGIISAGTVRVLYATKRLSVAGTRRLTERTRGLAGAGPATADQFGFALGSGDFNGSGRADLAIGALQTDYDEDDQCLTGAAGGAVHVLYGIGRHVRLGPNQFLTEDTPGIAGAGSTPCDGFGFSFGQGPG
ncbi:MAG: FG-GAP repeat protein [Solirubrobacterales bacterium]